MNPEGDQGVGQSGFILQDVGTMSPRNAKRSRGQIEEGGHTTALGMDAQCVKALNFSGDNVSSDGGGDGREDQGSYFNNLTFFQSEKRVKCGPFNLENNSQTPIPSSLTANVDVMALDGGNNVSSGTTNQNVSQEFAAAIVKVSNKVHTFGIEGGTQFQCDICSVKSTSAKDLETHLAGKRHAKAKELALVMGTSCITKSPGGGSKSEVFTPQNVQASTEHGSTPVYSNMDTTSMGQQVLADGSGEASKGYNGSTHLNPNMDTTSLGQQVLADGSDEASKAYNGSTHVNTNMDTTSKGQQVLAGGSGEASKDYNSSGTNTDEVNVWASSSKCPDSSDAKAVAMGQHTSIDSPVREVLKNDPVSTIACEDGHNRYLCQHAMNGSVRNPTLPDGFLEKICSRVISEGEPHKRLMALLGAKSNSDCVARALASALSTYGCPGLGDLQEGSSFEQAAGCSDSQLEGAKSADGNGLVTMHTRCFSNLLHDVRVSVMEDLFQHGALKSNTLLPSAAQISASGPSGEDLNCSVCRVEYGSKADLDLHLAGKKHASLVQRVYSRCELCNLNCNTERDFKTHLSGKKHASKLRLVQKRVTF